MNIQDRSERNFRGPDAPAPIVMPDARLATIYEQVGVGIVEVDDEARILRVNEQVCRLTGYVPFELLGRTVFQETLPEDVDIDRAQFERQRAGELDRYTVEKRIYRKGGGHFWAEVTSSTVRDDAGRFVYAVRAQHDISARKQAEHELARRMDEQAALFQFAECLQHASAIEEVYEVALEAIMRGLDCERASILLFDETQRMRFVAWRNLSDGYRSAVEGHLPWHKDETDPLPLVLDDIAAADLVDSIKQVVTRERIAAAAFIPIVQSSRLIGKFMAYYDRPRRLSESQTDVALTLARQLGFSIARFKAEKERSAAERGAIQLAAIVESSDDAIISKNLDGVIQTWNDGARRLFGYTAEEAIGRPVTILFPPGREDEEPGILARISRGERIDHYETVRQHKDGRLLDISLTVSPMRDRTGTIFGASKIARDITERKEAQRKLEESERHLQDLLAAIPAAIYTTDAAGKITYFNQAAVELAGRTPTIGSDEWCVTWKLFNPDGTPLPHGECPMAIALKEGRAIRNAEAIAERPDGSRVPFIPYPTPLRDASGKIVGAINMLADISERRQAENQQRLLLQELNHRTKNNMQVLQSLLSSAARNARSEEAKLVLAEATGRIAAMAAAQRVLYGQPDATQFRVDELLGAVSETLRQIATPKVRIVCEGGEGALSNDVAMPLALILNELITNAIKHGSRSSTTRANETVRVALKQQNDEFELSVEDDGEGFDLDAVRPRSSGLQLVSGLARQLRGRFEVRRNPSRASLRFPASKGS